MLLQEGILLLLPRQLPSLPILHQLPHPTTILPPLRWETFACHLLQIELLARYIIIANCIHLQNYPNLSQPPPAFTGQYPNSGQFTSAGSSGYGQYQSAPAHPPAHGAGHPPYQAPPYAGQASAVSGYQVRSGVLYNNLNTLSLMPGNESISNNRRLPAAEFNRGVCSHCTWISSTFAFKTLITFCNHLT